jgi:hypothetical protein
MGFVGIFVHQLLQSYALTLTTAVRTGWLIGIIPIWSALLAALFLRERFGLGKIAGLALGFLGAALVVTRGRLEPGLLALPSTRGDLLILVSTLTWAVYTVLGHDTIRRLGSLRATAGAMLAGWLMLAPWFLGTEGWRELEHVSAIGWWAIAFLGVGCRSPRVLVGPERVKRLAWRFSTWSPSSPWRRPSLLGEQWLEHSGRRGHRAGRRGTRATEWEGRLMASRG